MANRITRQMRRRLAALQRGEGASTTSEYAVLIGIGALGLLIAIGAIGNMTTTMFADAERQWNAADGAPTSSVRVTIDLDGKSHIETTPE